MSARRQPGTEPLPPATFASGARIEVRGEEWIVRKAEQTSLGDTALHVTGLSELVRNKDAIFLTGIDTELRVLNPEETALVADPSPGYRRSRLYLESLLRQSPPTDARLYRGHRGAIDPADYQLVPAAKALSQPRSRLLIAEEKLGCEGNLTRDRAHDARRHPASPAGYRDSGLPGHSLEYALRM